MTDQKDIHWLRRRSTIRLLWIVFIVILALSVGAELAVDRHAIFGLDGIFGFNAWYGLGSCVVLVFFSKLLGVFLKRPDTYYDR